MTKNLGITVYLKKSSNFNSANKDPREKQKIMNAIIQGEAKFTWDNLTVEREGILRAISQGRINFDAVKYEKIDNVKFDKLISANEVYAQDQ